MAGHSCDTCGFRARYDKKPTSFLGRLWRWHASWCPGFSAYMKDLPAEQRQELAMRYQLKKFMASGLGKQKKE